MTENQLKYLALQETMRHNEAMESDATRNTVEKERSNRANEMQRSNELSETKRSNLTREGETNRSNVAHENISLANLNEEIRSNMARERETNRSNLADEAERYRHNVISEAFTGITTDTNAALAKANTEYVNRKKDLELGRFASDMIEAWMPG